MSKVKAKIWHKSQMADPEYRTYIGVPRVGDFVEYGQSQESRNYRVIKVHWPHNRKYVELTVEYANANYKI